MKEVRQHRRLETAVEAWMTQADEADRPVLAALLKEVKRLERPDAFTLSALRRDGGTLYLVDAIVNTLYAWPSRNKGKALLAIRRLLGELKQHHGIAVDDDSLPKDIPDITQRRLDMLRFLHTPRSRREIQERYLISERTLRDDLNALEMGWELFGNVIRIRRSDADGRLSYNSTAHPIMLTLNLTEVYALVAGFPKVAEGTVFQEIAGYLSRAITSQLSGYALDILRRSEGHAAASAQRSQYIYRQEQDMLRASRKSWLLYLLKRFGRCRIRYVDPKGEIVTAEGSLFLPDEQMNSLMLSGCDDAIPLDSIIELEPLDGYQ